MLTERDTLNKDGTFNWRALREVATLRALAEHDADIVSRVYGPVLRLPAGVDFSNVGEWKAKLARDILATNPALETTPFLTIYRREYRRAVQAARAIRNGMKFRNELVTKKITPIHRLRVVDQLIASVKEIA